MVCAVFSLAVCFLAFGWLGASALAIRLGRLKTLIPSAYHERLLTVLAIGACLYAIYCAVRLATLFLESPASVPPEGLLEVAGIAAFWFIAPPAWFFVEYFAVEKNCIVDFPNSPENLKATKDYADYASKIWAGVVALLIAMAALRKNGL